MAPSFRAHVGLWAIVVGATVVAQTPIAPRDGVTPRRAAGTAPVVPFTVGEVLRYDVSWSSYLTAGTATITVRERTAGSSPTYHIVAEGEPIGLLASIYPVHYRAETWMEVSSLLPREGSIYSQEGRRSWTKTTRFDRGAGMAAFEVTGSLAEKRTLKVPRGTHDALSAFFSLRTVPLKTGARLLIPVSDDGDAFSIAISVGAPERVLSGLGAVMAWKLTPTILDGGGQPVGGRRLTLWITDDGRRLPVRLESDLGYGTFVLLLQDARR